ncbi:glycosyl hydrolase 115 family protein [Pseudoduganella sp. R-43]|uniref:glycosyl hydrolase 115 family protein n=1 Tax=unclassified Pseudoduganella TaxID=2637179 RepID=UPI003CF74F5B
MRRLCELLLAVALLVAGVAGSAHALGQKPFIATERAAAAPGSVVLVEAGRASTLYVDAGDHAGVLRAAASLQEDIGQVSGVRPALENSTPRGKDVIIIGTLGKSHLVDGLVKAGKLDAKAIAGKWEGWLVQSVAEPMPGVERALVIAGSDKRGTIFGIYELSEQIGVSPWYWWADVPVKRANALYAALPAPVSDAPAVQYRGIFLNDEAPALTGWAKQHYGGYNHQFYEKVFELILRLRGNYLWPAMWDAAFYDDDPLNGKLADEYGVVIGTSHHEPMARAHKEWTRYGKGPWDYSRNEAVLKDFWWKGAVRAKDYEKIVTLGMRGDGDEPMSEESNVALLQRIVGDQRKMLSKLPAAPQVWALYKEVQDYYEKGMRVPDDVILLWCDDNWANIRRLPTAEERKRPGGAGVYYHFDYVGGPRSYKWLNVTPIPKIWEQMHLAWEYDARKLWIVNVGDLKPMEVPIEFFLSYAWKPDAWPASRLQEYLQQWAAREFGPEHAVEIADIVAKYTKYNGRRKPEQLEPETYSLVNYNESERVVGEYRALAEKAERINGQLPEAKRDAFFELVLYPVKAGAVVNELYATAGMNRLYARQGRAAANVLAERARELFRQDAALSEQYHALRGGKWNHMMSQTRLGYTYWNQPPLNVMPAVSEVQLPAAGALGVAVEGHAAVWPGPGAEALALPALDAYEKRARHVEVFNRGSLPLSFTIIADQPWLVLSRTEGSVAVQERISVDVRWADVPRDAREATLTISGDDGSRAMVRVPIRQREVAVETAVAGQGGRFVETGGVVSIEAAHFTRQVTPAGRSWLLVPDHGRTLSAMTALPVHATGGLAGPQAMRLEYDVALAKPGRFTLHTTLAPTQKFQPGGGLKFAVSIDNEAPQIVNMHADASLAVWERSVSDGAVTFRTTHAVRSAGAHTIKFWAISPGVVLQKLVLDAGGLKPSYLGPQESPRL